MPTCSRIRSVSCRADRANLEAGLEGWSAMTDIHRVNQGAAARPSGNYDR
jgi:hypothetical protein